MNLQQKDFVKLVLRRTRHPEYQAVRGPVILTGPAGTGKTNTMITAILQVLQGNSDDKLHVLICTPSHTAADNIVTRLSKHLNKEELFRLYDSTRPVETVPIQTLGYTRQSGGSGDFCLPTLKELLTFRVIICTCDDAHILYRIGVTNEQLRVRRGDFARYMDQASHACNIGVSMSGLDKFHFTHLFIDEAAQATEPESLIPLSVVVDSEPGVRKCEIVLVGDPRQLSPSVYSNEATVAGLGRSWMERLLLRPVGALGGGREHMLGQAPASVLDFVQLSFRENLSIFLTRNYRGHPSFLMIPSALFYFDKLQSAVSMNGCYDWCQKLRWIESLSDPVTPQNGIQADLIPKDLQTRKQFDWPIHLRGVQGRDCSVTIQSGFAGNSWQNVEEANTIVDIAVALSKKGVSSASIGVMAPFRAQVVLIRDLMRRKGLGGVNVGLVEDYQAVERDVILLSLTRSSQLLVEHDIQQRMGLFGQPKRCNVALTRAKSLLVVVGDPRTMLQDFVWRQFVLFCLRNGLFYGYHGDDDDACQWNPNKKIVATRPESNNGAGITLAGQPSVQQNCVIANDPDLIFISSLERSFRDTKYK